jgi:hypothetical protein
MVDHRMSLRDRAKQVLRMFGHALTVTVHDRLHVLEGELHATQRELRAAKLVETHTSLLEASIHIVENLHALGGRTLVATEPSPISAEAALMAFLYSHVPARVAITIYEGDREISEALLGAGYEVYALEAGQTAAMARRNGGLAHVARASGVAGAAGVAGASGSTGVSGISSVAVETLIGRPTGAIPFDRPEEIGLIALGCDALPAVREFGDRRASVITADLDSDFEELVGEMRSREYHWHLVLYRTQEGAEDDGVGRNGDHIGKPGFDHNGNSDTDHPGNHMGDGAGMSYYANHSRALPNSRGSAFFFRDYRVFAEAQSWCAATLPCTYFKPRQV